MITSTFNIATIYVIRLEVYVIFFFFHAHNDILYRASTTTRVTDYSVVFIVQTEFGLRTLRYQFFVAGRQKIDKGITLAEKNIPT